MKKIDKLIEIASDKDITISQKFEKIRGNPLDMSIMLLLLDMDDQFPHVFPSKIIQDDISLLDQYSHPSIDDSLYQALLESDEFIISILKKPELFEEFNEKSKNKLINTLNQSRNKSPWFLEKIIDNNLLYLYIKHDIFSNGFIEYNMLPVYVKKIIVFVKENPDYFTEGYLDSLESVGECFKPYIAEIILDKYKYQGDFISYCENYFRKNTELFLSLVVPQITDYQFNCLINSSEDSSGHTYFKKYIVNTTSDLESKICSNFSFYINHELDDNQILIIINNMEEIFSDDEDIYRLLIKTIGIDRSANLFKDSYIPSYIQHAIDLNHIKNGDYSSIKDIEVLNDLDMSNEELIAACIVHIKHMNMFWLYDMEKLDKYEEIKLGIAEICINENLIEDKEDYNKFELGIDFYLKHFSYDMFLHKIIKNHIEKDSPIIELFNKDPEKVKSSCYAYINSQDVHDCNSLIISLLKLGIFTSNDIMTLSKSEKILIDSDFIPFLSISDFKSIIDNDEITKLHLLTSPHIHEELRNEIIESLGEREIIYSSRLHWIKLELSTENYNSIWEKVKQESNRDLKDLMFDLILINPKNLDPAIMAEIHKRSSKLKGYEDLFSIEEKIDENIDEDDIPFGNTISVITDPKLLAKKFTKSISSPAGAFEAIHDSEFSSILNEKNLIRAFKKISQGDSHQVEKVLKSDFELTYDLIEALIPERITNNQSSLIIKNSSLSEIDKIIFFTNRVKDEGFSGYHFNQDLHSVSLSLIMKVISLNPDPTQNIVNTLYYLSEDQKKELLNSDEELRYNLINDSKFFDKLSIFDKDKLFEVAKKHLNTEEFDSFLSNSLDVFDIGTYRICLKHSPKTLKRFSSKGSFDGDYAGYDDLLKEAALNPLIHSMNLIPLKAILLKQDLFTTIELQQIFTQISMHQKNEFFQKGVPEYINKKVNLIHNLSPENLAFLLKVSNVNTIPSAFLPINIILQKDSISVDEWNSFFDSERLVSKLITLSPEEKQLLLQKIESIELNLDLVVNLFKNKEILGYQDERLEQLIFKLDGASLSYLFTNFNEYTIYFKNITDESKIKLLELIIKDNKDISNMKKVFAMLPKNHRLRIDFINKADKQSTINDILSNELDDAETAILAKKLVENKYNINSYNLNKNNLKVLVNIFIDNDCYSLEEDNSSKRSLAVYIGESLCVATFTNGQMPDFLTELNFENRNKLQNKFSTLDISHPIKIMGVYLLVEEKFIPNQSDLSTALSEDIARAGLRQIDENATEFIDAIKRFSNVDRVNAFAERRFSIHDDTNYSIQLLIDDTVVNSTSNYDQELLELLKQKESDIESLLENKLKINNQRTFGFELEFSANKTKDNVAAEIRGAKIKHAVSVKNEYKSSNGKTWDLKLDGSVQELNGYAMELASPILSGNEGIEESREVLNAIFNKYEVIAGERARAGLHVHHDIKDFKKLSEKNHDIISHFMVFQESLYSLCEGWRQNNKFCSKIKFSDLDDIQDAGSLERTVGFNISPYGTMEFRMKESMTDTDSIIRWIVLTQKVVDSALIGLKESYDSFKDTAEETLAIIQVEKAMQLKKIQENDELLHEISKYNQARIFSDLILNKN